jgi:hypothetical protein
MQVQSIAVLLQTIVIKLFIMYKPMKLQGYKDSFTIKAKNRRFAVVKKEVDGKNRNMIYITSLTSETGKEDGVIAKLSENEKIKYSLVGLSDEAIKELYTCIHYYLKNVL